MRPVNARFFVSVPVARPLLASGLLVAASAVAYAAPVLDDTRLIDGLVDRHLDVLLEHLAETGDFADPSVPRLIEIGRLRAAYLDRHAAGGRAAPQPGPGRRGVARAAGATRALRVIRRCQCGVPSTPSSGWCTGWTSSSRSAADFYELGVPTAAQRAAFEDRRAGGPCRTGAGRARLPQSVGARLARRDAQRQARIVARVLPHLRRLPRPEDPLLRRPGPPPGHAAARRAPDGGKRPSRAAIPASSTAAPPDGGGRGPRVLHPARRCGAAEGLRLRAQFAGGAGGRRRGARRRRRSLARRRRQRPRRRARYAHRRDRPRRVRGWHPANHAARRAGAKGHGAAAAHRPPAGGRRALPCATRRGAGRSGLRRVPGPDERPRARRRRRRPCGRSSTTAGRPN